jgi:hypothetical protein
MHTRSARIGRIRVNCRRLFCYLLGQLPPGADMTATQDARGAAGRALAQRHVHRVPT